jgi:hypothetical protein
MKLDAFLKKLNDDPTSITLDDTLATIAEAYEFTPFGYTLGGVRFESHQVHRSCQLYAFAQLNRLSEAQTLACFGAYYHQDVLQHPDGTDHKTVRLFMKHGWAGLALDGMPLKARRGAPR